MHQTHIIFYDGVCHLCNGLVQFILKYERQSIVSFAQLQSKFANRMISNLPKNDFKTVLFYNHNQRKFYNRSSAVIQLLWYMGGFWKLIAFFLWVIPRPIRNFGYHIVSHYRYRLFGKSKQCFLQPKSSRFIGD
tara:strand:- start:2771 stop:3172 length:402 start_codon:yes stop_codon:yes gene_type:complete